MLGGLLPIPFKMWMYNDFVKYKKGFGKWMFNRLAANPPVFTLYCQSGGSYQDGYKLTP